VTTPRVFKQEEFGKNKIPGPLVWHYRHIDAVFSNTSPMADDSTPSPIAPPALGKSLQCFSGSFVAGTMAMLAYRIMLSIAANFAARPVLSDNPAVANISAAVRTLVVGMAALGAGVFGLAALGIFLLGVQLLFQRLTGRPSTLPE
jgi:hypothetical protein